MIVHAIRPVLLVLLLLTGCEQGYLPPGPPRAAEGPQAVTVAQGTDSRLVPLLRQSLAARSLLANGTPRLLLSASLLAPGLHVTLTDPAGVEIYVADVPVAASTIFHLDAGVSGDRAALAEAVDDAIDTPGFRAALLVS